MIDIGHPFSTPYKDLIDSLEESIHKGVEQPCLDRFVFQSSRTAYELSRPAHAIDRVAGQVGSGVYTVFVPGSDADYRFSNNRIIWNDGGNKPDEGGRFEVAYTYRERPAGLTDFNPGSVVGTLVRAMARELKLLYEQMDQAYRRAFIDHASGVALDNVVALLGLERNPAIPAKGAVTFFRKKQPPVDAPIVIPAATRVADESDRVFVTTTAGDITADSLDADGLYSVTVSIEAVEPGPDGNVNAETIVIMPTPPTGVEGVINKEPIADGKAAEPDDQLRERAKFHLERLGNATLNAIRFAVLEVDEVDGVAVTDHSLDGAIPLGEVHVSHSGGDPETVRQVVEDSRAAGILAVLGQITKVLVSGAFYVIPESAVPGAAISEFKMAVLDAINALEIGDPLSSKKLNALVYGVNGLAQVAEAQLEAGEAGETSVPISDPHLIERTQLLRPDEANLDVALINALKIEGAPVHNAGAQETDIQLQLLTADGPVQFINDFGLDLNIAVRARPQTAPDQSPTFIGNVQPLPMITFTQGNNSTPTLTISATDIASYDPGTHHPVLEITIGAAIFPGIQGVDSTLDWS